MTKDQLKELLELGTELGGWLAALTPNDWDDRIVEFFGIASRSDELLEWIVGWWQPVLPPLPAGGPVMMLQLADGTQKALDPATLALLIQLVLEIIKIIRERRGGGGGIFRP